jgi:hypothetical protein
MYGELQRQMKTGERKLFLDYLVGMRVAFRAAGFTTPPDMSGARNSTKRSY